MEQVNHIQFYSEDGKPLVGVQEIMELNIRLREDLTRSFDNYIKVVQTADNLKKENAELKLQLAK